METINEGLLHRFSFNFILEGMRLKRVPTHPGPAWFLGIHSLCIHEIQPEGISKGTPGRIFTSVYYYVEISSFLAWLCQEYSLSYFRLVTLSYSSRSVPRTYACTFWAGKQQSPLPTVSTCFPSGVSRYQHQTTKESWAVHHPQELHWNLVFVSRRMLWCLPLSPYNMVSIASCLVNFSKNAWWNELKKAYLPLNIWYNTAESTRWVSSALPGFRHMSSRERYEAMGLTFSAISVASSNARATTWFGSGYVSWNNVPKCGDVGGKIPPVVSK